jgi:hypothetical protein
MLAAVSLHMTRPSNDFQRNVVTNSHQLKIYELPTLGLTSYQVRHSDNYIVPRGISSDKLRHCKTDESTKIRTEQEISCCFFTNLSLHFFSEIEEFILLPFVVSYVRTFLPGIKPFPQFAFVIAHVFYPVVV